MIQILIVLLLPGLIMIPVIIISVKEKNAKDIIVMVIIYIVLILFSVLAFAQSCSNLDKFC